MASVGLNRHDGGMTESNAEPTSAPPPSAAATTRLRRRASDRVAAGVASGLADYLNVDPLLIRVALVGLVLFNGAGFFIYLLAWLFIPVEGRDSSVVEGWVRRVGVNPGTAGTVAWILFAIVGTIFLLDAMQPVVGPVDGSMTVRPITGFALALVVIAGGILLVRRTASSGPPGVNEVAATGEPAGVVAAAPPAVVARRPRERSPLAMYVLGLLLLTIGLMAAIDGTTTAELLPGKYAGAALTILGLGLLAGAWWGRARWLILVGLLIVPIALVLSFITVPLDGGWGEHREAPTTAAELEGAYHLGAGRLTLDLSELPPSSAERHVAASIGLGRLVVILPEGSGAEVSAEVGAGTSDLLGSRQEGTGLSDRELQDGSGGTFVLDLEAGLGEVIVRTAPQGE